MKNTYNSILETIGRTPLVEIKKMDTGKCRLFVKLENQNPGGSIKDRIALSMITEAENSGKLVKCGTIIEATAGNTGIGLALVGLLKGYRIVLVIPDKMSQEKINHLVAMGAEIIITRSDVGKGHPDYYQDRAKKIAEETGAYYINQFENPANPRAHYTTTGPEIWEQMNHKTDAIVAGIGSSGTITGLSRYFGEVYPLTELVLADPAGSVLADYINTGVLRTDVGSWLVEGIGEDFIPPIADLSRVHKAYTINDKDSIDTVRELLRKEGILAGSSSGTLVCAAIRYCKEQTEAKNVVTFICDSGNKYLSKIYNPNWLRDRGLKSRKNYNDLRDIIGRRHEDKTTISLSPGDSLKTAVTKMKLYDISQLPVLQENKIVGIIDESDLLLFMYKGASTLETGVENVMSKNLVTLRQDASIDELLLVFDEGLVAIIEDGKRNFYGLITKIDLINFLNK